MKNIFAMVVILLACTLLGAEEAPKAPAATQAEVELVQNGLFNDPSGRTAFWSIRSGGLGTVKVVPSKEEGTSGVFTANVKELSPKPWDMELLQRFDKVILKASVVYISFDYRITPGYSFNFYWQEERSPWPKLLSLHVDSPTETWHRVRMAVTVHEEFQPQMTAFSFHLAERAGKCELRNISAVMLPQGTNPETLSVNVTPVLGGDFYDKDWRALATSRLESTRKVPVNVKVIRKAKGKKGGEGVEGIEGVEVTLTQTVRPFEFGAETSFPLFQPNALKEKENAALASRFKPLEKLLPKYRAMLLDKSRFSFITFRDGMVWRDFETWGRKYDKAIIKSIRDAGLSVRGHALFVPAYMFAPIPCRKMDRETLGKALLKHAGELAARHKGKVRQWNVIHGGTDYSEIYNFVGVDCMVQVFQAARNADPDAKLLLSDLQSLSALSDVPLKDCIELAEWLQQSGVKLDGVVLGANMKRPDVGPQFMEKRIEQVSGRLRIPIHIANFAVNAETEDSQAAMISDYMLLFYSMGCIESVSFAESWAPALLNPRMGLYNDDLSPRPAAKLVDSLLREQWWTRITDKTSATGDLKVSAFMGKYEISAKTKDTTVKFELDLRDLASESFYMIPPSVHSGAGEPAPKVPVAVPLIRTKRHSRSVKFEQGEAIRARDGIFIEIMLP